MDEDAAAADRPAPSDFARQVVAQLQRRHGLGSARDFVGRRGGNPVERSAVRKLLAAWPPPADADLLEWDTTFVAVSPAAHHVATHGLAGNAPLPLLHRWAARDVTADRPLEWLAAHLDRLIDRYGAADDDEAEMLCDLFEFLAISVETSYLVIHSEAIAARLLRRAIATRRVVSRTVECAAALALHETHACFELFCGLVALLDGLECWECTTWASKLLYMLAEHCFDVDGEVYRLRDAVWPLAASRGVPACASPVAVCLVMHPWCLDEPTRATLRAVAHAGTGWDFVRGRLGASSDATDDAAATVVIASDGHAYPRGRPLPRLSPHTGERLWPRWRVAAIA
jgi:hypothetical protein